MDKRAIIDQVRGELERHGSDVGGIEIDEAGVRQDGHWWYVPVRSAKPPPKLFGYYELLTDIEDRVKAALDNSAQVLLVPCS